MKNKKKDFEEVYREDIIDVLLDKENRGDIVLQDSSGKQHIFSQIAVIPTEEKLYCILKPLTHIDGVSDDEALVFYVYESEGEEPALKLESDQLAAMDVFDSYYQLLDEAHPDEE